jgi:hypothetical protein
MGIRRNALLLTAARDKTAAEPEKLNSDIAAYAAELRAKHERKQQARANNRHRLRVERQRAGYE